MLENNDNSVSMISLPDLSLPEMNAIPLACWQNISLSKIWIPSHLLTNRKNSSSTWVRKAFHHMQEIHNNCFGLKKNITRFFVWQK